MLERQDLYYNRVAVSDGVYDNSSLIEAPLFAVAFREDESVKDVTDETDITGTDGAFIVADRDTELFVSGSGSMYVEDVTGSGTVKLTLRHYNQSAVLQNSYDVLTQAILTGTEVEFTYSQDLTLQENDYVVCAWQFTGVTYVTSFLFELSQDCNTVFRTVPEAQIKGVMFHEAMTRCLQMILSKDDPFYSPLVGRTD